METITQQTFQLRFNVVFRLIWGRDVEQRQINVKTTLCMSTLKFTTLCFSTLNWTTLDNVEPTLSFSTSIFTTLGNVETTLRIWPFEKKYKPRFKNKIIFLNFKEYVGLNIFLHFFPILTLSWRRSLSYRNQSTDLKSKSIDWFLYDKGLRHESIKKNFKKNLCTASKNLKISHILNNRKYI